MARRPPGPTDPRRASGADGGDLLSALVLDTGDDRLTDAEILAEALRLYPPSWAMGRQALDDHPVGGHWLATIARRWRLRPVAGRPLLLDPLITLRPRGGLWMRPTPR